MSHNQSRAEKSEPSQYRKLGRSGSSGQPRNFSGSTGKGGGTAPPPSSSSSNLSSNRSFKKSNNAVGGLSRVSSVSVNSDSNHTSAARAVQNGPNLQPSLHGAFDASANRDTINPQTDGSMQKSTSAVPKTESLDPVSANTDSTPMPPSTPAKDSVAPGDASKSFPLQFGSISPGFMNGMQIPARTSSAPPNLDEQNRDQARHASFRAVRTLPIPSPSKQQSVKKDAGVDQTYTGEGQVMPKAKRDVQVSSAPPVSQPQKPSAHPVTGISMQMPFNQQQVPIQFGGPNQQVHSQGIAATSMAMPIPMSLPIGNTQVQQPVYIPTHQPHTMQPQGIIHQGQSLSFSPQLGSQLPPQLGNFGIGIGSQFPQQQTGQLGGTPRKTVKITHPETHEELRLDRKRDSYMEGGSSGPMSHPNVLPQSQPIPSFPPGHSINYYPNSYNASSLFFPPPSSIPLSNNPVAPSSQGPRFSYPVSQGIQTVPFVNHSALNSFPVNKAGGPSRGIAEPSNLEYAHEVQNYMSSAPVQVTVKPAASLRGEKGSHSSLSTSTASVEKDESSKYSKPHLEASSNNHQRKSETSSQSSLEQSKHGNEPMTASLSVAGKQSAVTSTSVSAKSPPHNALSSTHTLLEEPAAGVGCGEGRKVDINRPDSIKDQQKKPGKKGYSEPQEQVGGQPIPVSGLPSQSLGDGTSVDSLNPRVEESTFASSETSGVVLETTGGLLVAPSDGSDSKILSAGESLTLKSLEMNDDAQITLDNLESEQFARQGEFSLQDGQQKHTTAGTGEQGEIRLPKVAKQEKELAELEDCSTVDEIEAANSISSNSSVLDAANSEKSPSSLGLVKAYPDHLNSTTDTSLHGSEYMGGKAVVTNCMPGQELAPLPSQSVAEVLLKHEGEGSETESVGSGSVSTSSSKDISLVDPNKGKSNTARGKKKMKEIFQKADAAGAISDLYMAYKGPDEKKETVASSENAESTSSNNLQQMPLDASLDVSNEKDGQSKAEPDDWEDAADVSTPKLETSDSAKPLPERSMHYDEDGSDMTSKKYSRDFLLKFSVQYTDLPEGFEITSDTAEAFMVSNVTHSVESSPSPGRNSDRPSGGSRPDRRGRGVGDDDKKNKVQGYVSSGRDLRLDMGYGGNNVSFRPGQGGNYGVLRVPGAQTPVQYAGGILSGPMQSLGSYGGAQRNNADSDRWQRTTAKGLIPSPQTPLQVMHKAERKYQVGKVTDEEEAKQRQLKGILNKLTPQNFEKLFEQVKAVNIDNAGTLTGVISQIFDKALMEPTFCEMYADFCYHLAGELPDFSEDNEKITFKRLLLNKCQEEFERGEREQEEANRTEEEGEVKQSEEEREEKRIRARRRMLGNIRLIGELYKKKMLTERIMHECIKKLLGQYQNPDEEDLEALCKLMSTIGEMIDHSKAKEHMDAYFDRMTKLSNNMNLSSRVRFMLRDSIDLRKNKWQQRRKVEGPKKIEEVHRDAAQERQGQTSRLARGPGIGSSVRRGQPVDFGQRGSNVLSSPNAQMGSFRGPPGQPRGYGNQDVRSDERHLFENRMLSVPLPHRTIGDESITLGPQGGLARGMSFRGQQPSMPNIPLADMSSFGDSRRMATGSNGFGSVSERTTYGTREDLTSRPIPGKFPAAYDQLGMQERNTYYGKRDVRDAYPGSDGSLLTPPPSRGREPIVLQNESSNKELSEERLQDMSMAAIREFYSAKDEKEVALCVKELNAPSFYPSMISIWVTDSFERKDFERDILAKLLVNLTKSQEIALNQDQIMKGFESVLTTLEDAVNDAPKAAEFLGRILAKFISDNLIPFARIAELVYVGGEKQGRLVEIGLAAEVIGTILEIVKLEKGESAVDEIRTSSTLRLEKFRPPNSKKQLTLDKFI